MTPGALLRPLAPESDSAPARARPPSRPQLRWLRLALLALALAVGALLRLQRLDLVEFKDDEASVSSMAYALAHGREFPLRGITSSVGVANPPAFEYLMAVPYALTHDPGLATGFIGLLNVAALALTYRLGARWIGPWAALAGVALLATSPWAVMFSRKIQAQDALPLFTLLLWGSLFAVAHQRSPRQFVWACLWAAALVQLHLSALAFLPALAVVLAWRWRALGWRAALAGAALFAATFLPFVVWEQAHSWVDVRKALALARQPSQVDTGALRNLNELLTGQAYPELAGISSADFIAHSLSLPWLSPLLSALFLAAALFLTFHLLSTRHPSPVTRHPSPATAALLLLWWLAPLAVYTRHAVPLYPHYFIIAQPAAFLALGWLIAFGAGWLAARAPRLTPPVPLAAGGLVALLAAPPALACAAFLPFTDSHSTFGGYGVPLRYRLQAVRAAQRLAPAGATVYVGSHGQDFPAAVDFLADGRFRLRQFNDERSLVVPAEAQDHPVLYLLTTSRVPAADFLLGNLGARPVATVEYPGGDDRFLLFQLDKSDRDRLLALPGYQRLDAALDNDVVFRAYRIHAVESQGGTPTQPSDAPLRVRMLWQIGQRWQGGPEGRPVYVSFNHLLDDAYHSWGQNDLEVLQTRGWVAGDLIATWADLPVDPAAPTGEYWWATGMYDEAGRRVPIRDAQGKPLGDMVRLGPLKVHGADVGQPPPPGARAVGAVLGGAAALQAIEAPGAARPGEALEVTLYWSAARPLPGRYTAFLHLLDTSGRLAAQVDGPPRQGLYPTDLWAAGEVIRDPYRLPLPPNLKPDRYRLVAGLYDPRTLQRLSVTRAGAPAGDAIDLGEVRVGA